MKIQDEQTLLRGKKSGIAVEFSAQSSKIVSIINLHRGFRVNTWALNEMALVSEPLSISLATLAKLCILASPQLSVYKMGRIQATQGRQGDLLEVADKRCCVCNTKLR